MKIKFQKYALESNFMIYLFGKGVSAIISLLSIPFFIDLYGMKLYGDFVLKNTTFLMLLAGSIGWISQSVYRYYSRFEANKENFSKQIEILTLRVSVISGLLLSILFLYQKVDYSSILLIFIAFVFACLYSIKIVIKQSDLKSIKVVISEIIRMSLMILIPFLCSFIETKIPYLIQLFFGIFLGNFIGYFFLSEGKIQLFNASKSRSFKLKKSLVKPMFFYGIPLSVWMFFAPSSNGTDRYIIKYFVGLVALAEYSAVYDIVFKLFSQFSIPLNSIVQPLLMSAYNKNDDVLFRKTLQKSFFYLTSLFLFLATIVYFSRHYLIVDYLGIREEKVADLTKIVIPLIFSSYIWQIAILLQKRIEAANRSLRLMFLMIIVTVVAAIISIWLVPIYGYLASSYIMLASSVMYLLLIILQNNIQLNENK